MFNTHPLMLSVWFCLAGTMDEKELQEALSSDVAGLWDIVHAYHNGPHLQDERFPPGPAVLAARLRSMKSSGRAVLAAPRPKKNARLYSLNGPCRPMTLLCYR